MRLRSCCGSRPVALQRPTYVLNRPSGHSRVHKNKPKWQMQAAAVDGAVHISEQVILIGSGVVSLFGPLLYAELRGSK